MSHSPVVIVGESWNAVISLLTLKLKNESLIWIPGMGSSLLPPVDVMDVELSKGRALLEWLAIQYDIPLGDFEDRSSFREFRNRAFHLPQWGIEEGAEVEGSELKELLEIRETELFGPENAFAPIKTGQYSNRLIEFLDKLSQRLFEFVEAGEIKKISNVRLKGLKKTDDGVEIVLSSGEKIQATQVMYADRWSELSKIEGIQGEIHPSGVKKGKSVRVGEINRKWKPTGVLQIIFEHDEILERSTFAQSSESFFTTLHKDSLDQFPRRVWGYFFDEGKKSIWTVFLSQKEVEDNKEITKKLRRVKQALNKIWTTADYEEESRSFTDHVTSETVRFEESVVFESPQEIGYPFITENLGDRLILMTEGFGLSMSMEQSMIALANHVELEEKTASDETPSEQQPSTTIDSSPVNA